MALLHLEDYLDTIESLPGELARNFTLMRELDARAQDAVSNIEEQTSKFMEDLRTMTPEERVALLQNIAKSFKDTLKHGEDKVALAVQTYDMVDRHIRRLDDDLNKFEEEQMTGPGLIRSSNTYGSESMKGRLDKSALAGRGEKRAEAPSMETPKKYKKNKTIDEREKSRDALETPKRTQTIKTATSANRKVTQHHAKKERKGEIKQTKDKANMLDMPIDPNEPTYCICNQVSFGDMIA
ncbi:hypothetical protein SpCBS45565_g02671 [Spizellomyces sp. 'palustris']|nr:hypothetical protein SpCBS45565_g02671 [Spizellomyces sp. 'palustris']